MKNILLTALATLALNSTAAAVASTSLTTPPIGVSLAWSSEINLTGTSVTSDILPFLNPAERSWILDIVGKKTVTYIEVTVTTDNAGVTSKYAKIIWSHQDLLITEEFID